MTSFPLYGCTFCPHTYASESRCGQHMDHFLRDYCTAYTRTPTTHRLESHPVAAIRAVRMYARRRPGKKHHAVVWEPLTVAPAEGVVWEFIHTLNNQADLDAFKRRPVKSAAQWLVDLGAVHLPDPESPTSPSSSPSSSSSSSSSDEDTITLASPAPPTPTPAPRPAPRTPTVSSRKHRINVLAKRMGDGVGAGTRETGISVRGGNSVALDHCYGGVSVDCSHTPLPAPVAVPQPTHEDDADDEDDDTFAMSEDIAQHASLRPLPALRMPQPAFTRSPPAVASNVSRTFKTPPPRAPLLSPNSRLISAFFTPDNTHPGYFELRVDAFAFSMWVTGRTRLEEVQEAVERKVLARAGWLVLKGLRYAKEAEAEEDGGGEVWSVQQWEDVKREGRSRKMGVVEAICVFE